MGGESEEQNLILYFLETCLPPLRCGDLSDKIDCSCNVYAKGGHLLCHDDVIGGPCWGEAASIWAGVVRYQRISHLLMASRCHALLLLPLCQPRPPWLGTRHVSSWIRHLPD